MFFLGHAGRKGPPPTILKIVPMPSYPSVDALQKALARDVFGNRRDTKKAAGRALGTIVELITLYVLHRWGFKENLSIERGLAEFANDEITHNVEFGLHRQLHRQTLELGANEIKPPLSSKKLLVQASLTERFAPKNNQLLTSKSVLRNACTIGETKESFLVANLENHPVSGGCYKISLAELAYQPFAMVECKRVGVEDGARKGPTTIEKAKQGAYVAKHVSALQKVRAYDGSMYGVKPLKDGGFEFSPLESELQRLIFNAPAAELEGFILTVGVVSNHGNWFTSENPNKELRVLQQSYDWLLFLTDAAIAEFVTDTLLSSKPRMAPVRRAFKESYGSGKSGGNKFTKVTVDLEANAVLNEYFSEHLDRIEKTWFNILTPARAEIDTLKKELRALSGK
jgi:hypothetical protein